MLFPLRLDYTESKTFTLGSSVSFELTREFHIEEILVKVAFTCSGVMATDNADGVQNILKRASLTVADGARTRNVVDCSGPGLLEYYNQVNGQLDYTTQNTVGTDTAAAKELTYPIPFGLPNLDDPGHSYLLLPTPRFNSNPVLRLDFSSQAEMDGHATPTFAITGGTVTLIIKRRSVLSKSWPTYDCELLESTLAIPTTGRISYELQSPGSYTGILMRTYTAAATRGDITSSGGQWILELLGTNNRRWTPAHLQTLNTYSKHPLIGTTGVLGYNYFLDFLSDMNGAQATEFGSVLDANLAVTTGARNRITFDATGGTGVQCKFVTHRIYGVLDNLKMLTRVGKKSKST